MQRANFSVTKIVLAALLASLVNILPMLLFDAGGDMHFHLVLIDCFARQFWQGDLYPRWCMEANSGFGAPVFLFYFPLPYYAASLLYPLAHFGAPLACLYTASLFAATFLTCLTCHAWLRTITTSPRALLVSVLILFMPYRMEAMLFRAGYAEIWGMAFMPLVFLSLRRLVQGDRRAIAGFALSTALLLLAHVPLALVTYILCGIYVLAVPSGHRWHTLWRCKLAGIGGIAMAAFYLFPGVYFRRFMLPPGEVDEPSPWANGFLTLDNVAHQGRVVAGDMLAILVLILLSIVAISRIRRVKDSFQRREIRGWLAGAWIAGLLLFPVSAPLYEALKPWSGIVFPWRMQAAFLFATGFLLAIGMEWFASHARLKTWKGDYGMLLALLLLLAFFMVGVRPADKTLEHAILDAHLIAEPEYRTLWQDKAHFNDAYIFSRLKKAPPQAEITAGRGEVQVKQWQWDGIVLETEAGKAMSVRLDQAYFPTWAAQLEDGTRLELAPEKATGAIMAAIPPGKHTLKLHNSLYHALPVMGPPVALVSALAWLACLWRLLGRAIAYRIACWALTKPVRHARFRA